MSSEFYLCLPLAFSCPTRGAGSKDWIDILTEFDRLIDDNGKDITAYNVRGEMCVRGPTVVKGYFKNDKANAESWDSEGYFKTGDILYCDGKTKKWYVVDRKKVSIHAAIVVLAKGAHSPLLFCSNSIFCRN